MSGYPKHQEVMMGHVSVAVSQEGGVQYRVCYDEEDVRNACRMLPCGDHCDSCIRQMEESTTTCELCRAVLSVMRKAPMRMPVERLRGA